MIFGVCFVLYSHSDMWKYPALVLYGRRRKMFIERQVMEKHLLGVKGTLVFCQICWMLARSRQFNWAFKTFQFFWMITSSGKQNDKEVETSFLRCMQMYMFVIYVQSQNIITSVSTIEENFLLNDYHFRGTGQYYELYYVTVCIIQSFQKSNPLIRRATCK